LRYKSKQDHLRQQHFNILHVEIGRTLVNNRKGQKPLQNLVINIQE